MQSGQSLWNGESIWKGENVKIGVVVKKFGIKSSSHLIKSTELGDTFYTN